MQLASANGDAGAHRPALLPNSSGSFSALPGGRQLDASSTELQDPTSSPALVQQPRHYEQLDPPDSPALAHQQHGQHDSSPVGSPFRPGKRAAPDAEGYIDLVQQVHARVSKRGRAAAEPLEADQSDLVRPVGLLLSCLSEVCSQRV